MAKADALSREDWAVAGLSALVAGGIEAVKVERLAVTLGVSKGSFYWHFQNRAALLDAMLEAWTRNFTLALIENSSGPTDARARMMILADEALNARFGEIDVVQAETALRAWAMQDPRAAKAMQAMDQARLDHLTGELRAMGAPRDRAILLAKGIYMALLGLSQARRYAPDLADGAAYRALVELALNAAEAG